MYLPGAQTSLGGDTFTLAQESVLGDPADQEAEGSHSPALGSEGRDSGAAEGQTQLSQCVQPVSTTGAK